jgi:hypothetical protein
MFKALPKDEFDLLLTGRIADKTRGWEISDSQGSLCLTNRDTSN